MNESEDVTRPRAKGWPVLVAWLIAGLTLLLMLGSMLFAFLSRSADIPAEFAPQGRIVWLLGFTSAPIVGALIASRQPDNPYGWVWLLFSLAFGGVADFAESYSIYRLYTAETAMPLAGLMVLLTAYGFLVGLALLPFVLLLFPTGHLLTRRWRVVGVVTLIGALLALATGWTIPLERTFLPSQNPFTTEEAAGRLTSFVFDSGVLLLFFMAIISVVSLLIRFRRSAGVERQQIKWFAFAAAIWIISTLRRFNPAWKLPGFWDGIEEALALALLPIAIGIAILRYRLYDIDVIIRRTLVYTVLTAILLLIYFGSVVGLQTISASLTGRQPDSVIVVSTLLIAGLFTPLRRRVQDMIDRRFYRRKYDAEQTLAMFAASARNEVELDALAAELLTVVEETMQPTNVALWLKPTTRRAADYHEN
jgi:hypothetical protein